MDAALDAAAYVHEGFWTNWSKGSVTGRTLTLCPTYATLLTNSLALFVTLSGGQLWTILRFSLHQYRTSRTPGRANPLRRQEQVVLRNATTNFATLRLMSQVAWASRRTTGRPLMFCLLIVVLALVHAVFFMIAGAFSNNVANAGQTVLSRSKYCGIFNETYLNTAAMGLNLASDETMELSVEYGAKAEHDVQLSLEYAQQCYLSHPQYYMSSTCSTFRNSTIEFGQSIKSLCPFDEAICHDDSQTIVFDTGIVDSNDVLGVNARPKDRLSYERITSCAVLNDTAHVTGWNGSSINSSNSNSDATAYANYGPSLLEGTDWTYSYSDFASLYTNFTPQVTIPYQVGRSLAYGGFPDYGSFVPIPELVQDTADVTLFFLSFTGSYTKRIDDPWFSAHQVFHADQTVAEDSQTQFLRDRAISTLACTERHQFCTHNGTCTGFLGVVQLAALQTDQTNKFTAVLNPHQAATFDRILQSVETSILAPIVTSLALTSTPLLAMNATASDAEVISLHLPKYQWQTELNYWHSIAMAQLQRGVVEWGTGQIAAQPQYLIHPPPEEQDRWFCKNITILSTVYQSFSVVALGLIIASGGLVILISLTIEDTAAWVQKRRRARDGVPQRASWDGDDMLKLQRAARRNSWRPEPPPKQATPTVQQQDRKDQVEMQEISHVHPVHRSPISGVQSVNNLQQPQSLSPERMWLDLPPPPLRDSWIAKSHKSFNFGFPQEQVMDMRPAPVLSRDMRGQIAQPSLQVPHRLQISDLREHALARTKRTWI